MAWARPKRTPEDGVAKARPKGMAAKRIQQATAPAPIERRNGGQIPRVSRPVEASTAPSVPVIHGTLATEALFGQNPFLGVECVSGPPPATVEEVVGVDASHRSPSTPLAWQEEETLLEEKSLSPIGQTSSPKAFTSPASPPTLASSHIYRQSPCRAEPAEPERPAVKEIAEIVADAEAQILRKMEGWTTEGSMLNQLAIGSMSDLRLSSAIAGDCMKLKSTVEDLKARMADLAEENLRLRNELLKRDDGIRTPRTPTVANLETQTMLQMMQQQLQQQQQLIQLLGTSHLVGAATPPTQVPEVAGRCFQWQPTPTPVPGIPGVSIPCWRPSVAAQEPVGPSQCRSCSTTPRGPLVTVPVLAPVERIQAPAVRFQRASSVPSQRGVPSAGYLPMQALQGIPMVQRAGSVTTLRREEPQVMSVAGRSSSRTSEVKNSRCRA